MYMRCHVSHCSPSAHVSFACIYVKNEKLLQTKIDGKMFRVTSTWRDRFEVKKSKIKVQSHIMPRQEMSERQKERAYEFQTW